MVLGFGSLRAGDIASLLRRPPVLFAGSFLIVGGVIATNALYMQPRRHPAPLIITREAVHEPQPQSRRADDLVLAVQAALRRVGYYSGSLDGMAGPQTRAAILAFEAATNRPQTGVASLDLLASIDRAEASDMASLSELAGTTGSLPSAEPAPLAPAPATPDPKVAAVQHALAISAYGPVEADGFFGPETEQAIVRFQRDHGLAPTGKISDGLMVELRAVGALEE